MVAAAGIVLGAVGSLHQRGISGRLLWTLPLWSLASGLVGYLFYGLALPGSVVLEGMAPGLRGLLIGFAFGLLPLAIAAWVSVRETRVS
jgi:hypothetical protein